IINQLTTEFEVRKRELLPYCRKAQQLLEQFSHVEIKHVPRSENEKADALASLAAALSCTNRSPLHVTIEERRFLPSAEIIEEVAK
ncbi:reverse transcriptase-like protein, partial [Mycobacterium kansasii]